MTARAVPVEIVFDSTNPNWHDQPEHNVFFLRAVQNHVNQMLVARGHVFLNEVYDELGLPRTSDGAISGWHKRPIGYQTHINFGLTEYINALSNWTETTSLTLRLKTDGVIYDKI